MPTVLESGLLSNRKKYPETRYSRRWFFTPSETQSNPRHRYAVRIATNTRVAGESESISATPDETHQRPTATKRSCKGAPPISIAQSNSALQPAPGAPTTAHPKKPLLRGFFPQLHRSQHPRRKLPPQRKRKAKASFSDSSPT